MCRFGNGDPPPRRKNPGVSAGEGRAVEGDGAVRVPAHDQLFRQIQVGDRGPQLSLEDFKASLTENDKKYFEEVASLTKTIKFLKDNAGKAE